MIKLVIFDFSGTLAYCEAKQYREVFLKLRDFNLPVSEESTVQLEGKLGDYFSNSRGWAEFTDRVVQKLGIVLESDRREALADYLQKKLACKLFGDVESVLSLPQKKAILTLTGKFVIDDIPALGSFEVFSPEVTGLKKPDAKAFRAVLERTGVFPEETVMVGDSLENDILPAKALGMKTVLIDRAGKFDGFADPEIIKIKSLEELKRHL